jgi:two-component system, cell cycle response regulator DivK
LKRILVVDDNPISRELVREVLDAPDRVIVEAAHGQEALDRIAEQTPDLVLLDIQMPMLDGFSVIRRIRQDPRLAPVRVLALTAFAMKGDRQKALAAGFDDYVTKPIDCTALRKQVEQILGVYSE